MKQVLNQSAVAKTFQSKPIDGGAGGTKQQAGTRAILLGAVIQLLSSRFFKLSIRMERNRI